MKRWLLIGWFIGLALVTLLIISQGITVIQGVVDLVGGANILVSRFLSRTFMLCSPILVLSFSPTAKTTILADYLYHLD